VPRSCRRVAGAWSENPATRRRTNRQDERKRDSRGNEEEKTAALLSVKLAAPKPLRLVREQIISTPDRCRSTDTECLPTYFWGSAEIRSTHTAMRRCFLPCGALITYFPKHDQEHYTKMVPLCNFLRRTVISNDDALRAPPTPVPLTSPPPLLARCR